MSDDFEKKWDEKIEKIPLKNEGHFCVMLPFLMFFEVAYSGKVQSQVFLL